jgi:hypothetical protein
MERRASSPAVSPNLEPQRRITLLLVLLLRTLRGRLVLIHFQSCFPDMLQRARTSTDNLCPARPL